MRSDLYWRVAGLWFIAGLSCGLFVMTWAVR
jgi:hypothetical protein